MKRQSRSNVNASSTLSDRKCSHTESSGRATLEIEFHTYRQTISFHACLREGHSLFDLFIKFFTSTPNLSLSRDRFSVVLMSRSLTFSDRNRLNTILTMILKVISSSSGIIMIRRFHFRKQYSLHVNRNVRQTIPLLLLLNYH
jgi:hypothetical protein